MVLRDFSTPELGKAVGETAYFVTIDAILKKNGPKKKLQAINEFICYRLGILLSLNIPPGFIAIDNSQSYYIQNLQYQVLDQLPSVDAATIVRSLPHLSLGIVLFDMWINNHDRHSSNLYYDEANQMVHLFDHGNALLGGTENIGSYLSINENFPNISEHCLKDHITSLHGIKIWTEKIMRIPEFYIRETFNVAERVGIDQPTIKLAVEFILRRRSKLIAMIKTNPQLFPSVEKSIIDGL